MATFKQFNSQDIIISPLEVNKGFSFLESEFEDNSINFYVSNGENINSNFIDNKTTTGNPGEEEYRVLLAHSIKQLYYSNYISGSGGHISNANTASFNTDGTITGPTYQTSYYNYEQNTVFPNKTFPLSTFGIISIPSKLYGDYIQPNSFKLSSIGGGEEGIYSDDGNGRITRNGVVYGNIIYQHGIVILNKEEALFNIMADGNVTSSFSSSYELFETQYKCTIGESEFNYSTNPTVLSGSEGHLYNQFTSSYFDPYVTTIGLYNEDYELLAVGKLAQPLPTSRTTDTTILVNIDR